MNIEKSVKEIDTKLNEKFCMEDSYRKYIRYIKFEDLFTVTNIYISAMRCAAGFRNRNDTQRFISEPWLNSYKLYKDLMSGRFIPKYYQSQFIMERGKVREIKPPVFESKVVQKLLCDWLIRPLLEPEMINTSYASVTKKGTDKMYRDVLRAVNACVKNKETFIIMTDFKGYFSSIDLNILRRMFAERIEDKRIVDLIMSFSKGKGLSLGNELSQIPASFYPTSVDKAVKKAISTGQYYRYMDDSLFIASNKNEADNVIKLMKNEVDKLNLNLKEPVVIPVGKNFIFCKERFLYDKKRGRYFRLCNKEIFSREKKKLKLFKLHLLSNSIKYRAISAQYKCVRNSIVHRANSKLALKRLDELYKKTFNIVD